MIKLVRLRLQVAFETFKWGSLPSFSVVVAVAAVLLALPCFVGGVHESDVDQNGALALGTLGILFFHYSVHEALTASHQHHGGF